MGPAFGGVLHMLEIAQVGVESPCARVCSLPGWLGWVLSHLPAARTPHPALSRRLLNILEIQHLLNIALLTHCSQPGPACST